MRRVRGWLGGLAVAGLVLFLASTAGAGTTNANRAAADTLETDTVSTIRIEPPTRAHHGWGLDVLLSNGGFGLGAYYRREFTDDLSGTISFSISESKDDREIERYDYFGNVIVPGKLSRFLVMPLMFGVQYRLFREDIMDSFRPYINGGVGPTMIYASPFTEITRNSLGGLEFQQVEFFRSLGKGQPHYTASAFVGVGAMFGGEKSGVFGVNLRYYFTYLLGDGLPSLYEASTGGVAGTKKEFGGFFITFNIGISY